MNKKTLMEIYNIIYEYAKQKQEHPEFIDLYKLYNIDPNKMASELKTDIRKVRRLIHIDQKRYIESSYYDFFDEIVQENSKLYDMEGNSRKKAEYDEKLKKNYEMYKTKPKQEKKTTKEEKQQESTMSKEERTRIINEIKSVIEYMILDKGFAKAFNAFRSVDSSLKDITVHNNCRKRLENIGQQKIKKVMELEMMQNGNDYILSTFTEMMEKPAIKERANDFYMSTFMTTITSKLVFQDMINDDEYEDFLGFYDRKVDKQERDIDESFFKKDRILLLALKVHKIKKYEDGFVAKAMFSDDNQKELSQIVNDYFNIKEKTTNNRK